MMAGDSILFKPILWKPAPKKGFEFDKLKGSHELGAVHGAKLFAWIGGSRCFSAWPIL
jgi:hypothetical protein